MQPILKIIRIGVIDMQTIVNFRDIGGYSTKNGKMVKKNRFFRSGELVNVCQEDQALLIDTHKINRIYDFRNQKEKIERPDDEIIGTSYMHIDLLASVVGKSASLEDLIRQENMSPEKVMNKIYQEMILADSSLKGYQTFFEDFLSHPDEPLLFHCFAGKDRTGIGAALILSALDVKKEAIFEDYLKTNIQRKQANDLLLETLRHSGKTEKELEHISTMLYVKREYLQTAFNTIAEHFGSVLGYFKDGLKLSEKNLTDMKKCYTC